MSNTKIFLIMVIIVAVGAFLRLTWLDKYPPGVTGDEIQQGYDGYSLLKTGKDEWGDTLPINPRGFGDYKPPLYSYLTAPTIGLFGLNITSVRLPSALAGIATIIVVYFLAQALFVSSTVGLVAAGLIAISPWHVQYSRIGWESNVGAFLLALGILLLIKGFQRPALMVWAALCLGLDLFTYHSFRVFTVLFLLFLLWWYRDRYLALPRKYLLMSGAVFGVAVLLVAHGMIFGGAYRRAADAAIYSPEHILPLRQIQVNDELPQPWGRVINNRPQFIASHFVENYLGYFSLNFLFSSERSNNSIFNLPGKGLLYIWQFFLLIPGVYWLVKGSQKWKPLLLSWLFLAPFPAALTAEYMHAQRVETFLPLLSVVSAYALVKLWGYIPTRLYKLAAVFCAVVVVWSVIGRIDFYLYHNFDREVGGLHYGYEEVVAKTEELKPQYDQIIFTKAHSEPHIFVAFYTQMDPTEFQAQAQEWKYFEDEGFKFLDMINYRLGKYYFKTIDWQKDSREPNTLIVGSPQEIPKDIQYKFVISDPFGKQLFLAVDTKDLNNK